ncbi:PREDICTED: uncharacterized protein At4g04775-like [Camelina sativa]|uniref:Uncharacterized protein At4g04775-like n=1 Tax=Camelina sativa TaxID=90675 RepID=A0ABM0UR97_CAMSA|nr:PREDICTED: uncharacterized protein At4g04775-like [Camelina sativa]
MDVFTQLVLRLTYLYLCFNGCFYTVSFITKTISCFLFCEFLFVELKQVTVKETRKQHFNQPKENKEHMGLHSYSQPSSSECNGYLVDEQSSQPSDSSAYNYAESEPELGFPKKCYCGAEPIIDTCYSRNDPGRKFFSCGNRDDGECHIWKWWDVAVMEEMRATETNYSKVASKVDTLTHYETELNEIKHLKNETDEKINKLEKLVAELNTKNRGFTFSLELVLGVLLCLVAILGLIMFK